MDHMDELELTIEEEIFSVIESDLDIKSFRQALLKFHPYDLAKAFEILSEEQRTRWYHVLDASELASIFEHLEEEDAIAFIQNMDTQAAANVLQEMDRDDAVDVLQELEDPEKVESYLNLMDEESRDELSFLTQYLADTAGSIMTTEYIALRSGYDVKDAMRALIQEADESVTISRMFVLDEKDRLIGTLDLKTLIQARSPKTIDELMHTDFQYVNPSDDAESVARLIQNYGIYAMPVIDEQRRLLGIVTMDDAADILEEESDEDYAKLAAVSSDEDVNERMFNAAWHRLPWLVTLLFLGLIVSSIISQFEHTISQLTVLVLFQPLILGMAGNTGTQSLAVTVRALSKDHFKDKKHRRSHLRKEFRIGMINGLAIGVLSFLTTSLFLTINPMDATPFYAVALVVGTSAMIALAVASLCGAFFPIMLTRMNIDPAAASGPFITTINDILGLSIYFTLASIFLLPMLG